MSEDVDCSTVVVLLLEGGVCGQVKAREQQNRSKVVEGGIERNDDQGSD